MVLSGRLNTLLVHERKPDDQGLGMKLPYKPTGKKLWGSVEQLSGSELAVAQSIEGRANTQIKSHYVDYLRAGDRLTTANRTFNIVAINNLQNRNRELWITCIETVSP